MYRSPVAGWADGREERFWLEKHEARYMTTQSWAFTEGHTNGAPGLGV